MIYRTLVGALPWWPTWEWVGRPCRREGLAWFNVTGRPYDRELDR